MMRSVAWVTMVSVVTLMTATAAGQTGGGFTEWQTPAGGDPSGNYISVTMSTRRGQRGAITGRRRVERVDAPSGYTTGTSATVVFSGSEPAEARTLRVHLPYGAALDLAAGEEVDVEASSRPVGLGSVHEVRVTRGRDLVLLVTSRDESGGVRVARGVEMPRDGSRRRFGVQVTLEGRRLRLAARQLARVDGAPLLVQGEEVVYEGDVRPPDAFDSRVVTVVRIRP